ncbi:DUF1826 domain-containing protein [Vibrio sp. CAIM 722]|uniref:DUF1826 domain-containing protein n=1 Tax=Vibrio eleionomae TaxID=2653505 RepID=A0A7X4RSQ2_9VIBR|nr:DUF1826 domain-containing protein [Vibrio eleionomae]MZI91836.1 DUF1826 domain-containing protein [Vibrio eleionomae]
MSLVNETDPASKSLNCTASIGKEPQTLTHIYQPEHNLVIWQRHVPLEWQNEITAAIQSGWSIKLACRMTTDSAYAQLQQALEPLSITNELSDHIAELIDMFALLFELEEIGVRLTSLNSTMCPRFHIDRVPCRLITTLSGQATEWLSDADVQRCHLGPRGAEVSDLDVGLYQSPEQVQQMHIGDVALLKGSQWEGNEDNAIVHRSPALLPNENRLLLTLDFG